MNDSITHNGTTNADEIIAALRQRVRSLERDKSRLGLTFTHLPDKSADARHLAADDIPTLTAVTELSTVKTDDAGKDETDHVLIEGDNLAALNTLLPSQRGKVNVIYVDPPYNTGNTDWVYNNKFIAADDPFRHSKWLSFMEARLLLAKELLADTGFIACTIDHYELFYLGALMDQIFGEQNRIGVVDIEINPGGRQFSKFFSASDEHMLVYAKNAATAPKFDAVIDDKRMQEFPEYDDHGAFRWRDITDGNAFRTPVNKPHAYYAIYISHDMNNIHIDRKHDDDIAIYPTLTPGGKKTVWLTQKRTFVEQYAQHPDDFRIFTTHGTAIIQHKEYAHQVITTTWNDRRYYAKWNGTALVKNILGADVFDYPKSLYAVKDSIKVLSHSKDDIVLDFFAGSGTTGHAVAELNKEDGGHRRTILVTNNFETRNDGSTHENGIARTVTAVRMNRVLTGKNWADGKQRDPLPGNLRYYRLDWTKRPDMDDSALADELPHNLLAGTVALDQHTHRVVTQTGLSALDTAISADSATVLTNEDKTAYTLLYDNALDVALFSDEFTTAVEAFDTFVHDQHASGTLYLASGADASMYLRTGLTSDDITEIPTPLPYLAQVRATAKRLQAEQLLSRVHIADDNVNIVDHENIEDNDNNTIN